MAQARLNLPEFSTLKLGNIETELDQLLEQGRQTMQELSQIDSPDWQNLVYPLDAMNDQLSRFFSPIRHLNSVSNTDEIRDVYNACMPKLSAYFADYGQHRPLFLKVSQLAESSTYEALSPQQKRCVDNMLRDFRLGGVALEGENKARYKEISVRLTALATRFQENLLDATKAWRKNFTDSADLSGLPQSSLDLLAQNASIADEEGYSITLDFPSYYAVMSFADNRALREEVYTAYMTRASDRGPNGGQYDNSAIMAEIIELRTEKASLLGFDSYADYSVETKMVDSSEQVINFIADLAEVAVPVAKQEIDQLKSFAQEQGGPAEIQAWDIAYYSDKLKQHLFQFSEQDLKPYFPADIVIPGLFEVVGRLFGISISEMIDADVWHDDVKLYEIQDSDGCIRGAFYFDNYARSGKRGGAWMDVCAGRMLKKDGLQIPVAYLTCNLTPPVGDQPALLTHSEVTTLFHEFGHGLHHMLTRVDLPQISGISGVEWDAVELPSQFLENWCWQRESLDLISGHFETGDKIPQQLLDKAYAARNFQSGMMTVRQLEFALFDMKLHQRTDNPDAAGIQSLLDQVRSEVAVVQLPDFVRFQNGFAHIFAGGYAAGYFSYKWAEVLSCDAFASFEDEGIFNQQTGRRFMECILERGGSRNALELFVDFRGREPQIDALIRHSGLAA